jgi:threonine dehydrogenase-like Zn-dependent dehydrogenase
MLEQLIMEINFKAPDYNPDGSFTEANYQYIGSADTGWKIYRNDELYLQLNKGYELLKTKLCGVCSTDLSRHFLPFPLPQVIGHELIASDPVSNKIYAVEINDTGLAGCNPDPSDPFIKEGLPTHSPDRMVLGIDRLPGGFGSYILAPKNAMVDIDGLDIHTAVLLEPFAAALQAVTAKEPEDGQTVAVLGPRRLGSLVIAALNAYRRSTRKNFEITALARHTHLLELSKTLGADRCIDLRNIEISKYKKHFDILYDTTGTESGFNLSIQLSKEVHLKTTNGQAMCGINKLTELVVDELSILPYSVENLNFVWKNESRKNTILYCSNRLSNQQINSIQKDIGSTGVSIVRAGIEEAYHTLASDIFTHRLPRFDVAIINDAETLAKVIRPKTDTEVSLVRPRGAILVKDYSGENKLLRFISEGGRLISSRCGDFHYALRILKDNPVIARSLSNSLITDYYPANELKRAFEKAKEPSVVKVVIKHE